MDLVYPPGLYCISCGKITDSSRTYGLCNDCMEAMNWITERRCEKCGRPLADTDPGPLCFGCAATERSGQPYAFDRGYACAGYGAAEQALIFAFKYGSQSHIGDILGEILYDRMSAEQTLNYDMVVPVPIHKDKKKKRGFNQAELMAKSFSKRAGIKCESELLIRSKETKAMKGLGPDERKANIGGAFEIRERKKESIRGASILLIDDIFTTGATLDEIARILKTPSADKGGQTLSASSNQFDKTPQTIGASRVDFCVFAAAADYLLV